MNADDFGGATTTVLEYGAQANHGKVRPKGFVKKNAIMMIDFALVGERFRGLTPEQAIYEACLIRYRPIMMTTMAALLGASPLALGSGAGSELRRPLGITILGGLLLSQFLTLFTTPVIYIHLSKITRARRPPDVLGREPYVASTPADRLRAAE